MLYQKSFYKFIFKLTLNLNISLIPKFFLFSLFTLINDKSFFFLFALTIICNTYHYRGLSFSLFSFICHRYFFVHHHRYHFIIIDIERNENKLKNIVQAYFYSRHLLNAHPAHSNLVVQIMFMYRTYFSNW